MLYYKAKQPIKDEIVFVTIKEFSTGGIYCNLIEYDDAEGFLLKTELPWKDAEKKKFNDKKTFKFGEIFPMLVLSVTSKGIDLSFKKIPFEQHKLLTDKFQEIQKVVDFGKEFSQYSKISQEKIFEQIIWKLFNKIFTSDDMLSTEINEEYITILRDPSVFFSYCEKVESNADIFKISEQFVENVRSRTSVTDEVISQNFELIISDDDAIYKLKEVLNYSEQDVSIKYISSPKYQIYVSGKDTNECNEKIQKCVTELEKRLSTYSHTFQLSEKTVVKQRHYNLKSLPKYAMY